MPCRQCWSFLYLAGAGAMGHMAAAVATLNANLAARAGLKEFLRMRRADPSAFPFRLEISCRPVVW